MDNLSLWTPLPELFALIGKEADFETKRALSMVNKRISEAVFAAIRSIRIFSPCHEGCFYQSKIAEGTPEAILVNVLKRYQNVENLSFGYSLNNEGFRDVHAPYLEPMIAYLESNPDHCLSSVKKIKYMGITSLVGINIRLLSALTCNNTVEKIKLHAFEGVLKGAEIQVVLDNSPHLNSFTFGQTSPTDNLSFSFAKQTKLKKVKLAPWGNVDLQTLESLKSSEDLKEFVMDGQHSEELKIILLGDHPWKLTCLEVEGIAPVNDQELNTLTKKLPDLGYLNISLAKVSNIGMGVIGKNCTQLKALKFYGSHNLKNQGLSHLTKSLPHLAMLSFTQAWNIYSICSIAENCLKLRGIQVWHALQLYSIDPLVEKCTALKMLDFVYDQIPIADYTKFAKAKNNLAFISVNYGGQNSDEEVEQFYKQFTHITRVPDHLCAAKKPSIKKLHKLVI